MTGELIPAEATNASLGLRPNEFAALNAGTPVHVLPTAGLAAGGEPPRTSCSTRRLPAATARTDSDAWHVPYDDWSAALSRRLRAIQAHINDGLDESAPASVTVVSCCSGDGRDLLQVLASRHDAGRVPATLLELDRKRPAR